MTNLIRTGPRHTILVNGMAKMTCPRHGETISNLLAAYPRGKVNAIDSM